MRVPSLQSEDGFSEADLGSKDSSVLDDGSVDESVAEEEPDLDLLLGVRRLFAG